jgi:Zn-dependent protease with chaperone function
METFFTSENPLLSGDSTAPFNNATTESLFRFALILQNKIFLWLLVVSGLLLIIGLIFNLFEVISITKRKYGAAQKQKPTRERVKRLSRSVNWSSTGVALAATVGIIQATGSLQFMSDTFPNISR